LQILGAVGTPKEGLCREVCEVYMYGYLKTPSTTCFIASGGSYLSLHSSTCFRETTKAYYTTARDRRFEI